MATSPVTSFLSQDYESLIQDVTRFSINTFPDDLWTDFSDGQIGTYLLRVKAYIGDLLGFQLNASVMETILMRVVRERNMRLIAQAEGYQMKSATGSSTTLRIYDLPTPPNAVYPFTISKHHQFSINGLVFQPLADKTVTAVSVQNNVDDGYYVDIEVKQGEETFEEVLGTSNGKPAQKFSLQQFPVQDGTLEVTVTADGGYTLVRSFTQSSTTDRHYRVYGDETGAITVEFGNGVSGKVPTTGQIIRASYRVGGGILGNFGAGLLNWSASGSSSGASPLPSVLQASSIRNLEAATGGGPKETVEQARRAIPGYKRTNDRAISGDDYGALTMLVPGVSHAKSFVGKPILGARPIYNFVVPQGGGAPSAPLLADIAAYLSPRKEAGRVVYTAGARYVGVRIAVEGFLEPTARRSTVKGYLERALQLTFNPDALDFSSVFPLQELYDAIDPERIPGLKYASIREFRAESGWDKYVSLPPIGSGLVSYIKRGQNAVTREWSVKFINPTPPLSCPEFEVYERVNATATSVTTNTVSDDSSYFPEGSFVGWTLLPTPEDGTGNSFQVIGNTDRVLEIAGAGLGTFLDVGRPFAVQKLVSRGKALKTLVLNAVIAGTVLEMDPSSVNWVVGDEVLVVAAGQPDIRTRIAAVPSAAEVRLEDPVTVAAGDFIEYVWKDPAGRVEFAVTQGTSPWGVGDSFYVDTYATAGDLTLRGSEFPTLDPSDLDVTVIGGVA